MTPKKFLLFKIAVIAFLLLFIALCVAHSATADEVLTIRTVQARGGLNVREAPAAGAPAVYLLDDTETVIVLSEMDGWALVAKNNGAHTALGWVKGDYLK